MLQFHPLPEDHTLQAFVGTVESVHFENDIVYLVYEDGKILEISNNDEGPGWALDFGAGYEV